MGSVQVPSAVVHSIKGKSCEFSPLGVQDFSDHAQFVRDSYMAEAKRQMQGLPIELAKFAWELAKREADQIQLGTQEYNSFQQSAEAIVYLLWKSVTKKHPDVSLEVIKEAFNTDYEKLVEVLHKVSGAENPLTVGPTVDQTTTA